VLPLCDVLLANEAEVMAMGRADSLEPSMRALGRWCGCVVAKCDVRGATALIGGELYRVPTVPVPVHDATGAGDAFNAGFLYGWLAGLPPETCLGLGNLCGGAAVRDFSGYRGSPTEPELLAAARSRGLRRIGVAEWVKRA
jgi:sugar/nucleoside kinase (ribokinase family)